MTPIKALNIRNFDKSNGEERKMQGLFQHLNNIMPNMRQAKLFTMIMSHSYKNGALNDILMDYIEKNNLEDEYRDMLGIFAQEGDVGATSEDYDTLQNKIDFLESEKI